MHARPSGIVTLTSDLGLTDPRVGLWKGALYSASDKPRLVDMSHEVPAGEVATGAFVLWTARSAFPTGTVHVGHVGAAIPQNGEAARILVAAAHGQYWLAPDNGVLGAVLACDPDAEVRALDLEHLRLQVPASGFDQGAVFAPVAAWLASGRYGFSAMGPRCRDAMVEDSVFGGGSRIVHVGRAGNLISNLTDPEAAMHAVRCGDHTVPMCRTPADMPDGKPFAHVGSFGLVEIAVADGSRADEQLGLGSGAAIEPRNS